MSLEDAMERMTRMLGQLPRLGPFSAWATLQSFVPEKIKDKLYARSSLASIMTASLELVKQGRLEIKQDGPFRPIYMREKPVDTGMTQDKSQDNDQITDEVNEVTGEEDYDDTGTN
jgi:segregation and condensation protein A